MATVRGEYPVGRLDILEDADKGILIPQTQVDWGTDLSCLKEVGYFLLKGDKFILVYRSHWTTSPPPPLE